MLSKLFFGPFTQHFYDIDHIFSSLNKWVIDEEAAEVVRRIYNMCLNGKGPYQIARELAEDKVERPENYLGMAQLLFMIKQTTHGEIY